MTAARLAHLRAELRRRRLDALVVSAPPHIRYLTGFTGSHALCVVGAEGAVLLTDTRYREQSRLEVRGVRRVIARGGLVYECSRRCVLQGCRRIGFDPQATSYALYHALKTSHPRALFLPASGAVETLMQVKDDEEVRAIREAALISDTVFGEILTIVRPGTTEADLAAEISYLQRKLGAEKDAFEPIVASGARAALPHARASAKRIRHREVIILDFGCTVRGYNSDLTRTVALGSISRELRRIYDAVLGAQLRSLEAVRAGTVARDLDRVARAYLGSRGLGRHFLHSLGHGLGSQVHEEPRISKLSSERLKAGNVITIEPGVYLPRTGGVRIEDDVLVTASGCEVITRAPKHLMVL